MKKTLSVISWVFTISFIVLALGGFPSLSSLFCFLSAILVLPVEKWQTLLSKFLKNTIRIVTVVVAFVFAICLFSITDVPQENNSKDDYSTSTTISTTLTTAIVSTTTSTTTSTTNTSTTGRTITTTSKPVTTISTTGRTITTTSRATIDKQSLSIIQQPNTVNRNELTTVSIKGVPNTKYTISVYYSSGASKADGLESKTSDSNGNVSWTWKVGGKTKAGTYRIVIEGGGQETTLYFTVI